jgi:hypothetical protein
MRGAAPIDAARDHRVIFRRSQQGLERRAIDVLV